MNRSSRRLPIVYVRIVQVLCACVLGIILTAGLWPFHVSRNRVQWLEQKNGLEFARHASIWSAGTFPALDSHKESIGALEIWLEPSSVNSSHTIVAFEGCANDPLSLHQQKEALRVQRANVDENGMPRTAWINVPGVFRDKDKPVFVTVRLQKKETEIYIDGVLAKTAALSATPAHDCAGRLILANSPTANDSWSGRILGLALYAQPLSPAQVREHYDSWTRTGRPVISAGENAKALYLFNEREGATVHNTIDAATDLVIPAHYHVLHKAFLMPPWREYHPTWSFWQDTAVNIVGFIPLGFSFAAYFSLVRPIRSAVVTTVVLGFAVSLTIEFLQAFLPTRDSGITDLFTNTLGTAIGVMVCRWSFTQRLLAKASERGPDEFSIGISRSPEVLVSNSIISGEDCGTNCEIKQR